MEPKTKHFYRHIAIEISASEVSGRWVGSAVVYHYGQVLMSPPLGRNFSTKPEAETAALQVAKEWIDKKLS
jgi:hypothetical protein